MNKFFNIEDNNYLEILDSNSNKIILIEFWANWCSPCIVITEEIEKLSKLYNDKILIIKAEIEKNSILINKFKIKSIPTILIIKKNKVLERISGIVSKEELENIIKKIL